MLVLATPAAVSAPAGAIVPPPSQTVVTGSATSSSNVLLYFFQGSRTVSHTGFFAFDHPRLAGVNVAVGNVDGGGGEVVVGDGGNADSADIGLHGDVKLLRSDGSEVAHVAPYGPAWHGAVSVAVADLTGDGVDELVTAPGPGGGPNVKVFQWTDGALHEIASWFAYASSFAGGVYVAGAGGRVVTGPGAGGGPDLRVFSLQGTLLAHVDAYSPAFRGGVRVGTGAFTRAGTDQVVTGPGPGGGPNVKVFNLELTSEQSSFFAYDPGFRGGVFVAGLRTSSSGDEIVTGAGAGGGPNVKVLASDGSAVASFFAYDPRYTGGVTVAAARSQPSTQTTGG
jgi:hypothetical protein